MSETQHAHDPATPVFFTEPVLICNVPPGSQLVAVGLRIALFSPGMQPCYVTPTGLEPMPTCGRNGELVREST